jgi:hypothetical protein
MAPWAWINAGEMFLHNGIELSFSSRTVALADLEKAQNAFEQVLNNTSAELDARERALNGLARTLEALSDGDTQPAIDAYKQLIEDFPESRFRRWAEFRIEELGSPAAQEFYAWYHEQSPDPADRPLPSDNPHAGLEGFSPFLNPSTGESNLPDLDLDEILGPSDTDVGADTQSPAPEEEATPSTEGDAQSTGPQLGPPESEDTDTAPPATDESTPANGTAEDQTAPAEATETTTPDAPPQPEPGDYGSTDEPATSENSDPS